jgi:salicylate hydroxylase
MSSSTAFQIIIVGGGIAGLSAYEMNQKFGQVLPLTVVYRAIALRAPGREITILEQSSLHAEIGATISLQPNASRILTETWKLGELLKHAKGLVDQGFRIFNTDGELVNTIPLLTKTEYGGDRVMYHRQDLHDCLKRAAISRARDGASAEIRVSSRVVSCDCQNATVTLENGEVIKGDLVIAADGIRSAMRQYVVGQVDPVPTGLSAYRLMVPSEVLEKEAPEFCERINPRDPFTSMVFAHSCRLIMSPCRDATLYSIVGLVPDEKMNEDPNSKQTWVSQGDINKALKAYCDFSDWIKAPFKQAKELGLWQLRDINPLPSWVNGRVILIGDAAHSMLPTQGQGASQTVEDAEALGAFFDDITGKPSPEQIEQALRSVVASRYERATLVQQYSREAAKPATDRGTSKVKM